MMTREGEIALAMLRESPDLVEDARVGARVGNSVVGSVMSLVHHIPRQYAEAGVREALIALRSRPRARQV